MRTSIAMLLRFLICTRFGAWRYFRQSVFIRLTLTHSAGVIRYMSLIADYVCLMILFFTEEKWRRINLRDSTEMSQDIFKNKL
mmetsp:Transcript_64186/g.103744  ORF Transcript_64186/g.103744 Transcript_64186/m.103744 type:complete len:83 (+) Transcript_64186:734-982(+)